MGMPLFAADALFTPLQQFARAVARRFAAPPAAQLARQAAPSASSSVRSARHVTAASRPLRVVRVVEGAPRLGAGRMVISGRMADVCAELERLAALEAAAG